MTPSIDITTSPYKMPQGGFIRTIYGMKMKAFSCGAVLSLAAAIICGCIIDYRLLIVAAMILFLILPLAVAFLYIYYALSPRCFPNTASHIVRFLDQKAILTWSVQIPDDDPDEPPLAKETAIDIPYREIERCKYGLKGMTLILSGKPFGFIYLPYSSFPPSTDFKLLEDKLRH